MSEKAVRLGQIDCTHFPSASRTILCMWRPALIYTLVTLNSLSHLYEIVKILTTSPTPTTVSSFFLIC